MGCKVIGEVDLSGLREAVKACREFGEAMDALPEDTKTYLRGQLKFSVKEPTK